MENLKKYILDNIIFDCHDDESGENFNSVLFDELDRLGIYHAENKAFFDIDPEKVIQLSTMEFFKIDFNTTIDDIAREAMQNLAFNYMYSELKKLYLAKFDAPMEDCEQ